MAIAIRELRKLQIGKNVLATPQTTVPATKQLQGDWSFDEQIDWYFTPFPRGVRAPTGAGTKLRQGSKLTYNSELTCEEIIVFAGSGLLGNVAPSTFDTTGKKWIFTPGLTGAPVIDSFTYEMVESDGTTNQYYSEFGYGMTESFKIELAFNQIAKLSAKVFGQAVTIGGSPTGGLSPYPNREILASNGTSIFIDTTYAGLGGTQVTGTMRSCVTEYMTGLAEKYNLDGQANNDMSSNRFGEVRATIDLTMDLEAQAAAMWTRYRAGTVFFLRALTNSASALTTPTIHKSVQQDLVVRLTANPAISSDGSLQTVSFKGETVYDTTSSKELELTVVNKETTY